MGEAESRLDLLGFQRTGEHPQFEGVFEEDIDRLLSTEPATAAAGEFPAPLPGGGS
ncbi:hypothetical protein [Nocardia sp. No.11]|uniref:hypothetical protein n=1 Tax=Nocardia sp. No.11 TaxID=3128861 RepID=UPI00319E955D